MMNFFRICIVVFFIALSVPAKAQELPAEINSALKVDDSVKISVVITKTNINDCYGNYSVLADAIRYNSIKCFIWLLENGADVNKICNGYVSPLMHAAKYGNLDMVKMLVAKGAKINYQYTGDYGPAKGKTPATYAEMFGHQEIADYLRSLSSR